MLKFSSPQINLYVEQLERSKEFYSQLGFVVVFQAVIEGVITHYEMELDGFRLGIATKESAARVHGLKPGKNEGCELVLWVEDVDQAHDFLLGLGAEPISPPHDFLERLRAGWVADPDGNSIQLVSKLV